MDGDHKLGSPHQQKLNGSTLSQEPKRDQRKKKTILLFHKNQREIRKKEKEKDNSTQSQEPKRDQEKRKKKTTPLVVKNQRETRQKDNSHSFTR
jgi:hypothetical protein